MVGVAPVSFIIRGSASSFPSSSCVTTEDADDTDGAALHRPPMGVLGGELVVDIEGMAVCECRAKELGGVGDVLLAGFGDDDEGSALLERSDRPAARMRTPSRIPSNMGVVPGDIGALGAR